MTPFPLKIVTPYGVAFDGQAEELVVRTVTGDIGILAGHTSLVAPLGMGRATIIVDGQKRYAACIGGILSVMDGHVDLVPTTFEWADQIDTKRAEASYQRAKTTLADKTASDTDLRLAEARLKRALVRKNVASYK
ncbi:MAG: ATP synthase F1 subunit epsilon [Oscillospiraceae bacterium]|nr:ATP synthase F1 subunit epsilon [Oscillospiraceae bacterium]